MKNKQPERGATNGEIILSVPVELKSIVASIQELLGQVIQQRKRAKGGHATAYAGVEETIRAQAGKIEQASHSAILHAYEVDAPRVIIKGQPYTRIGHAPGTYKTMSGPIIISRALYRKEGQRNPKAIDAINLRTGTVGRGWLPGTAATMAYMMQQGTSREAVNVSAQSGMLPYSRCSFERVAHLVGEQYLTHQADIEDANIQAYQIPDKTNSISVGLDRVSIPMEEPARRSVGRPRKDAPKRPINRVYRMAWCGTVTLHDETGAAMHTFRYGTMPDADVYMLCWRMANDVERILERRPGLRLTLLADGAHEMWKLLEIHFADEKIFGNPHRIVDFWHLIEKLVPAAKVIYGKEAGKIIHQWRRLLSRKTTAAGQILKRLNESGCEFTRASEKEPVHEAITYLESHFIKECRMDYATARKWNLPIGSGNTEATCKSLVETRMKRAGSRWKPETGEYILQLRALAMSDQWDQAMDILHGYTHTSVRPAA